jgi:hypothetical protein
MSKKDQPKLWPVESERSVKRLLRRDKLGRLPLFRFSFVHLEKTKTMPMFSKTYLILFVFWFYTTDVLEIRSPFDMYTLPLLPPSYFSPPQ